MSSTALWGLGGLIVLTGFIVFAFRQGMKVRRPPEGVPPEHAPTDLFH